MAAELLAQRGEREDAPRAAVEAALAVVVQGGVLAYDEEVARDPDDARPARAELDVIELPAPERGDAREVDRERLRRRLPGLEVELGDDPVVALRSQDVQRRRGRAGALIPAGRRSKVRASSPASRPLSAVVACCSAAVAAALSHAGAFAEALAHAQSTATRAAERQIDDRHHVVIPVRPRDRLGECDPCPRPPSYALKRT